MARRLPQIQSGVVRFARNGFYNIGINTLINIHYIWLTSGKFVVLMHH